VSAGGAGIETVLFDLDGTLSDSAPAILTALQRAFGELGVPWLDDAAAQALLGPPFWQTLPPLVGDDRVEEAITRYRKHYVGDGLMLDGATYDGVEELLAALAAGGIRMAVATSKPEVHARTVVAGLGFADYFVTIGGDTLDGDRDSKALVIGEVLARLGGPDPATVLMVGDRSHDVLGAAQHGIEAAGVLWGYGSAAELTTAGARVLCDHPADLLSVLGRAR
jgi:phosphoglycolate phosphatase